RAAPKLPQAPLRPQPASPNTGRRPAAAPQAGDVVKTYFGFREGGIGKNPNGDSYVTLNGKPVYLQLCLDQSYHPEGWYTFPSDEFMKNEILLSKKLGLSGNRVHIKVEVPRKLYWADKLGLLIQADVPCAWGDASEAMFEEHWKCFEGMVRRDFNHPSIYQWTLFNETWGLFSNRSLAMGLASGNGGKKRSYRETTQRKVAEAYWKAKRLDPTRVIEDNSPCNRDHVVTDVNTWHGYHSGFKWEEIIRTTCENTFPGSKANYIGGRVQGDEPMMNSECGNVWGYRGSTGDCDFTWDYHLMINAFRRHLKCAGWLYTEHHDVCNEWNGYVRFDRSAKCDGLDELAGMTLADFHRDAAIFFAGTPGRETGEMLAPEQKVTIPVGVSLTTDKYAGRSLSLVLEWLWVGADGRAHGCAEKPQGRVAAAKSWQNESLWDVAFVAPSEPACGRLLFALKADGQTIARNFWSFGVTNAASAKVVASKAEWSGGSTNVLGGLKLNGFGK
ncbi:MAG: glycoside hydrolase family 2, partial [bacterium]|nr:glycoside hydrolase family 2 [Candidatus Colisoma equi]